jgi:hypothetical protein
MRFEKGLFLCGFLAGSGIHPEDLLFCKEIDYIAIVTLKKTFF